MHSMFGHLVFNHYDQILLDSQNIIARLKSCTWNTLAIMSKLQRICSVTGVGICVFSGYVSS